MTTHSKQPYCPRTAEHCALAPQHLATVCHELGQHLHAFGLHASALDQTRLPKEAHEPLAQMTRSVQALELTIKTLHELVNLAVRTNTPVLHPVSVSQVFDRIKQHCLMEGLIISVQNYRQQVMSDPGTLFRLLRCALHSAARYSGMKSCNLTITTRKEYVIFNIVAPPKATPDRRKPSECDLDLEIAQILSNQIGHAFHILFDVDGAMRIAVSVPKAAKSV